MNKKTLVLLTFLASLLGIQGTSANNIYGVSWRDGLYIQGSGSVAWHNSQKFNGTVLGQTVTTDVGFDTGYGAAASIGTFLCPQWRLEAEVLWRRAKIDSINLIRGSLGSMNLKDVKGHTQDIAVMLNAYYDIPLWCCWNAYIGAGIGIDFNELKNSGSFVQGSQVLPTVTGKKHQNLFASQVSGGLSYDITDCLTFFAGYRLFMTAKEKLSGKLQFTDEIETSTVNFKAKEIPLVHSVDVGLRLRL